MKKLIFLFALIATSLLLISCNKESSVSPQKIEKKTEVTTQDQQQDNISKEETQQPESKQQLEKKQNENAVNVNESLTPLERLFANARFQLPNKELKSIDFKLKTLDGKMVSLSSFKGKVVFLNFWATWCPPCRAEIPSMIKLYNKFKDRGLEILGVDLQEEEETVRNFVKANKINYPILLDTNGQVGQIYGARSIPTTYIVDRKGNIIARTIGGREWNTEEIYKLFEKVLKQ